MGLLLSTGDIAGGFLITVLFAVACLVPAALLVGYHQAEGKVARACYRWAFAMIVGLHAVSLYFGYWKLLMAIWVELPWVAMFPLTTATLLVSPAIRRRTRGDAAGVELGSAEDRASEPKPLWTAVALGVAVGSATTWLFWHSNYWNPETYARFGEGHPTLGMLLGWMASAAPGAGSRRASAVGAPELPVAIGKSRVRET